MKNLILLLCVTLTLIGSVEAKYTLFPGTIAIGDNTKPEAGATFIVQSTTESSIPCPKMTEIQRDAISSPATGSCVYNTDTATTEYWTGASWVGAGSGTGLSAWLTGTTYGTGAFVYTTPDFKIWIANTGHTAGATFAGDIANWDEASPLEEHPVTFSARVDEAAGVALGEVVYINGATGNQMEASLAINNDFSKIDAIAVATEAGANNATITFQNFGELSGIDTSSYTEGDDLYLDSTAGQLTATHPTGVQGIMKIARVVRVHASLGVIFIDIEHHTLASDHNGIVRYQLVNQNAGTSASTSYTMLNDASHRSSISMVGSGYTAVPGIAESMVIYNEGYNKTVNAVDGNFGFEWWTDVTDSHNLSSTSKMSLSAAGLLTVDSLTSNGETIIDYTATTSDNNALEIDMHAAGFGGNEALDIDYVTGALAAGSAEAAILVNIDETLATGGDVYGMEVLATEGSATVYALGVGPTVNVIEQESGTFIDMDSALTIAVDNITAWTTSDPGGANNVDFFVADNDSITFGDASKFETLEFVLETAASQNVQPTFEYSTGSGTWATFSPIDGTSGFRNTGLVVWLEADIPSWAVGVGAEFLIRITRTRNGLSTNPVEDHAKISAVSLFSWDKNGDLSINGLTSAADILMAGTGQLDLPVGTTGERSGSPNSGMIRFNSTTTAFEGYDGSAWGDIDGSVSGGVSSTDNAIARWDSTTGKLIQDSSVVIDDDGRIDQTGLGGSVFMGSGAGAADDLTTNANVGIGGSALTTNTVGVNNTGVGNLAGLKVFAGNNNSFFGASTASSGAGNLTGSNNTAVGYHGLQDLFSTSAGNTTLGSEAGKNITVGSRNLMLGYNTGTTSTTASDNILIGYNISTSSPTASSELNIADLIKGDLTTGDLDIVSTTALGLPNGTLAQRPTGANGDIRYNSDSESFEGFANSSWGDLGGSGSGGINYLQDTKDSDFEVSVGNWVAFDDGAVTVPVDGTGGGNANWTCARNTTTPLRLTGDLKIVAAASDVQGHGCSVDFDIDSGMKARKLVGSFWYDFSDAGFNDDEVKVFIYDKTNTNIIRVNGEDTKSGKGVHYFQFQTASDSTSYRLIVMQTDATNTTGFSAYSDQVAVGPTELAFGSIATNLGTLTTTGSWNGTTYVGKYWRENEFLVASVNLTLSSAPSSADLTINLPSGHVMDTAKLPGGTSTRGSINAKGTIYESGGNNWDIHALYSSTTAIRVMVDSAVTAQSSAVNITTPFTVGASDIVTLTYRVPIVGWESTARMSQDLGGREVSFLATRSANQVISGSGTLNFDTEAYDTTASYDTSTYEFTIPESGKYIFNAGMEFSITPSAGEVVAMDLEVNGSVNHRLFRYEYQATPGSIMQPTQSGSRTLDLVKGDTVRAYFIETFSGALTFVGASTSGSFFGGAKLASPQTVLETETVAARFSSNNGLPSIPDNASTIMDFEDLEYDTHGAVTTGAAWKFTAPVTSKYSVKTNLLFSTTTGWGIAETAGIALWKNGAIHSNLGYKQLPATSASSIFLSVSGGTTLDLVKGDYIDIRPIQGSGGALTPHTDATYNYVTIEGIK